MSKGAWIRGLVQALIAIAVLAGGVVMFKIMIAMRKPPVRQPRAMAAPLVNAQKVTVEDAVMLVRGFGTVQPKVQANVVPQVAGKVVFIDSGFVNGGFFKAGQPLVKIDDRDYQLAVQNALAAVASAEVTVTREQAEAAVAKQEWDRLHPNTEPASPLLLREPQIRQAAAQLQAAQAQLAKARLDLERTVLSLPFDGRVAQEGVDLGQFLSPGQSIATAYATEAVEIVVPLEDRELAWFSAPLGPAPTNPGYVEGAVADVTADFAGARHRWPGRVVRTQGRIESGSRMVNVVVEVKDPFAASDSRPPLVPGMFAEIAITGRTVPQVARVPRHAVHAGRDVWVAQDGRLLIRPVEVLRFDDQVAYIAKGLSDGEVVITSPLDVVTNGMAVRTEPAEGAQSKGGPGR